MEKAVSLAKQGAPLFIGISLVMIWLIKHLGSLEPISVFRHFYPDRRSLSS